ncbi:hypothetical protein ES703_72574 [subsurface metagenome]
MKVNTIKRCSVILLLILDMLFAADLVIMYCQTNQVNVRSQASTNSKILGTLSINDPITPIDENDNWYKINYQDQDAWVYKTFFSEEKVQTAKYWYNSKSGVLHNSNCRWYGNTKKGYYTNEIIGRDCGICRGANRVKKSLKETGYKYWINTKSGVRHNQNCRWYGNTKQGYYTNEKVGRPCGICGG